MSMPPLTARQQAAQKAQRSTLAGIGVNGFLALVKSVAGILGNSYALIADAIESASDVIASLIVWMGLKVAAGPPTEKYPYGKGRAEAIAAMVVSLALFGAAVSIAISSVNEIRVPHHAPATFTLIVLAVVVFTKEILFRFVIRVSEEVASTAVKTDAWHHRSDAITSTAAFIGISVALIGGKGYESADDWAALFAAAIIFINAYLLLRPALSELVDAAPSGEMDDVVRAVAVTVPGVAGTHRCWVRKLGFDYFVELDILVDGGLTVREGHGIAHEVLTKIRAELPNVTRVMIHVEPSDEYGRHKLDWEK